MRLILALVAALLAPAASAQTYPSPIFQLFTARGCTGYVFGNGTSPITCAPSILATSISGLASSATTDATNAANINAGTLPAARLPAFSGDVSSSAGSATLAIVNSAVTAAKLASGAALANLGFTPANRAGDTFTGPVVIPFMQSGTGAAARTVDGKLKDVVSVADFCTDNTGATDCTTQIQAAITALQAAGGGRLMVPAGTYKVSGTLALAGSGVHLYGSGRNSTLLQFSGSGTADAFQIGTLPSDANCVGASQPSNCLQAYDISIRNLSIAAASRSGGFLFNVKGQSGLVLEDIAFTGWRLLQAQFFNTLLLSRVTGVTNDTTDQSISLFQAITSGTTNGWYRSDVASFNDVVVNNDSHGGSCVNIDGMINTVRFARTALLNCAYGLSVSNSQASASYYPAFLMTDDLEIDGSSKTAININAGREFHFAGCDINAKNATSTSYFAVAVSPDLSGSVTSGVYFTGCSVHTAPGAVAFFSAKHVSIDGSNFYDSNKNVTTGTSPVIQINGGDGFTFTGGLIGQRFGDSKAPNFGVEIDNGVGAVSVVGVNLKGALTKSISNASSNAISFVGGITYAGAANTLTTCASGTTC